MASKKNQKKKFKGMSYSEVQRNNSENRSKLKKEAQRRLKDSGYKNVGWDNVINLHQKIEELLEKSHFEDMNLEELFLEAGRVGNKYLSKEEIKEVEQQLSKEFGEISELIDEQFPDTKIEIIDFSQNSAKKPQKKRNQKAYRVAKL